MTSHGIFRLIIKLPIISLLPGGEGAEQSEADEGKRFLYKVLIKQIKFNFFQMEKWDLQGTFLSQKFPAPSKISLRPHIPCASGNGFFRLRLRFTLL